MHDVEDFDDLDENGGRWLQDKDEEKLIKPASETAPAQAEKTIDTIYKSLSTINPNLTPEVSSNCSELNCFDCVMTKGVCTWSKTTDGVNNSCSLTLDGKAYDSSLLNTLNNHSLCSDVKNVCTSNLESTIALFKGTSADVMDNDTPLYFTIGNDSGSDVAEGIPRNYFCSWNIQLNPNKNYYITIMRSPTSIYEDINLIIQGLGSREEVVTNRDLITNSESR